MFSSQLNFQESLYTSFYRDVPQPSLTGCLPHHQSQHYNHKKSSSSLPHANALCHFHIAASINPATGQTQAHQFLQLFDNPIDPCHLHHVENQKKISKFSEEFYSARQYKVLLKKKEIMQHTYSIATYQLFRNHRHSIDSWLRLNIINLRSVGFPSVFLMSKNAVNFIDC